MPRPQSDYDARHSGGLNFDSLGLLNMHLTKYTSGFVYGPYWNVAVSAGIKPATSSLPTAIATKLPRQVVNKKKQSMPVVPNYIEM